MTTTTRHSQRRELTDYDRKVVASMPPLTPERARQITALLAPYLPTRATAGEETQ